MSDLISAFFTVDSRDLALPLIVTTIGLDHDQYRINRESGHDGFHFFRCMDGEGRVEAGNRSFTVGKNTVVILYPNEPHCYYPVKEPWMVDWVTFAGSGIYPLLSYLEIDRTMAFDLTDPELMSSEIGELREMLKENRHSLKLDVSCQFYKMLTGLYWNMSVDRNPSREYQYKKIEPVVRFIEENYSKPLTLDALAEKAGVSPKHFCLLFREAMHVRPFRFINSLRINECKRMLLERREMSIAEISAQCGYENICYFNQVFKSVTGITPTEFRHLH